MVVVVTAEGLRQVRNIRKLAAAGSVGEIRRKLVEKIGRVRVSLGLRGLCSALEVRCDLLGDLLVLRRVVLLKLLQRAQHLGKRGKLAVVGLRLGIEYRSRFGKHVGVAQNAAPRIVRLAGAFERVSQQRL